MLDERVIVMIYTESDEPTIPPQTHSEMTIGGFSS